MTVNQSATVDGVGPTSEKVLALLCDNTPAVISLGKKIMLQDYSFQWFRGHMPILTTPQTQSLCV
jgi:hypothetical protein